MAFQGLVGKRPQWCYVVEVVAQHATELPLPAGSRALFVLKRRHRLSVTGAEPVDVAGGVEWNTRCSQTATLYKQGDGWRPKEFTLKVQVVQEGKSQRGTERAQTVAKAKLDFSQFCLPEPFGPKQLVIPLQPCGVLGVSVRTQYLQNYSREADSLTDISYLSLAPSALTSVAGMPLAAEEQDLSGFDSSSSAAYGGSIQAAWQPQLAAGQEQGPPGTARKRLPAALRLPWRGASGGGGEGGDGCQQQQPDALGAGQPVESQHERAAAGQVLQRSATMPSLPLGPSGGSATCAAGAGSAAGSRRPPGASLLQLPHLPGASGCEAETPTLFKPAKPQNKQEQQQQQPARGLPPEAWTPIDLQEAVDQLYDSDEEPTPKPTVLGTMKRMFSGKPRNALPPAPGSCTARQLHQHFGTPQPSPPRVTPDPCEVATIDREGSVSTLRRRCKWLLAERDEARAEGYAEATLAVELSLEVDKLKRTKEMLLQRLATTEEQLLACFRDEASTDLIRALAAARVEAAQRDFQLLQLQGELRRRDAVIDRLRAQLTRAETKYRLHLNDDQPLPGPRAAAAAAAPAPAAADTAVADAAAAAVTEGSQAILRAGAAVGC